MTLEEKNKVIQDYCKTCDTCKLNDICTKIHGNFMDNPDELEKAYEIVSNSNNDVVNHPNHYTNGGMECIDEMILIFGEEAVANFCLCNAWKYRRRCLYKNGEEDIQKSHWYINKYRELTACEYIQQRENI